MPNAKKKGKRRSNRSAAKRQDLSGLYTDQLAGELKRRKGRIAGLRTKRAKLQSQIEAVDAEIATLELIGGVGGRSQSTRGRNRRTRGGKKTLADVLAEVLSGRPMSVTQAAAAAKQAGYKTKAENFRVIVNQTLLRDKRFTKVARGTYTTA